MANAPLTEHQRRSLALLFQYLEVVMRAGKPAAITLHTDGQGNFAFDNVEVKTRVDLKKFAEGR